MDDYKTKLLLGCLAALVARSGRAIVIADKDIEAALDGHLETMVEHDHHAGCVRLTIPVEART